MMNSFCCAKCQEGFTKEETIVNSGTEVWHQMCFACSQCFRPFDTNDDYYEFAGRKYCEHDFNNLFAPRCQQCKEFIRGRIIKALNTNFHPDCFNCGICEVNLTEQGFIKNGNHALCHKCNASVKSGNSGKTICSVCSDLVDESELLRLQDNTAAHCYHFNCTSCGIELTKDGRERKGEFYCLRCHDYKMGVPVCAACHRPIETDRERVVTALGQKWHVEHFMCAKCEKPFLGGKHYERKGLAYCETHYHQLFGSKCFVCSKTITGDTVTALNKAWCKHHFACSFCDGKLNEKDKFYEVDLKPCCKRCFDKFPSELRKRLKNYYNGKKKTHQ